jgi:hypothetical protein
VPYEKGSKAYYQVERHPAPIAFCHAFARLRRHLSVNSLRRMVRSILWRREGLGPWVSRRRSRAREFKRKPSSLSRGTEGSNLSLSSGESRANLSSSISCRRRCAVGVAVADID